ncbi:MAG TPA: thiamine-phosphate kinase [Thermoplasmata archaeon]|jgi:thiamine-monophosphate kinase
MTGHRTSRAKAIDERRFHGWLARELPAGRAGLLPLGDDAAAIRLPPGKVAVLSIDALVEGTHFRRGSPPHRVGAAAAGVSLSDLAAKGAEPAALLLAIVVPVGTPQTWAEAVTRGAEQTAERFGMQLVGGDTKPGPVRTVVSSVVGWAREGSLAPRSGARPGDLIATTGSVGRGGVAAARLGRTKRPGAGILSEMLDVRPRVAEGVALVRWAHAMLDTSDGLAEASRLLAEASRVRVEVDEDRLPLTPALRDPNLSTSERRRRTFYGGDYELLLALPARAFPAARRAVRRSGGRLTAVGRVTRGRGAWLGSGGRVRPMPPAGWQPFARRSRRLL